MDQIKFRSQNLIRFLVFITFFLDASDIGSDSAVTRFNTQQVLQNGDRVAGFASLYGGFALAAGINFASFDCFFPVEGFIDLNAATLILSQDLIFRDNSSLINLGNIIGNQHVLNIAPSMNIIPSNTTATGCSINASPIATITGGSIIHGVDWDVTGTSIAVVLAGGGANNNVEIFAFNGTSLHLAAGIQLGTQIMNSVNWHPFNEWLALARNTGAGSEIYNYLWNGLTLTLLSSVDLGASGFIVNWHPAGNFLGVGSNVANNQLRVYPVSSIGVLGTAITSNLHQQVHGVSWSYDGSYIASGTNTGSPDQLYIHSFDGATLTQAVATAIGATVNTVAWDPISSSNIIAIGTNTNGVTSTLRLFNFTPPATLTEISTGVTLTTQVNSINWRVDGSCLAVGLNSSAGTEINVYFFENNTLTLQSGVNSTNSINAVAWARNENYLAIGDANAAGDLSVFASGIIQINNVFFSDVNIFLNDDVTFQEISITFSGSSSINGQGNIMTLAPTFTLQVTNGGSLLFKNLIISGADDSKIRCLSNSCTFSFEEVILMLDGNITFTQGQIDILGNLDILGPNFAFIYTSNQPITIRGGTFGTGSAAPTYIGSLTIDTNTTFSYAPANNSSSLIIMESIFSKIILNSGTLIANSLQLTKGFLQVNGLSTMQAITSLTIGDGTSVINNLSIEIMSAAHLDLLGNITYKNV